MRPSHRMMRLLGMVVFSIVITETMVDIAAAQDFRIETKIYEGVDGGDAAEPVSRKETLFHKGLVYDFLSDPAEVRVFKNTAADGSGRFIVLDAQRKMRSEISTRQIAHFMVGVKTWASQQDDPLLQFAAEPSFDETFQVDPSGKRGELVLSSQVLTYRLKTIPAKDADRLRAYRQYVDWSKQLHVFLNGRSTPPFPWLVVSESIARHEVMPEEVTITIAAHRPDRLQEIVIHARHEIRWRLSQQDRERINQVDQELVNFRLVSFEQYRR